METAIVAGYFVVLAASVGFCAYMVVDATRTWLRERKAKTG